jgi:hypothetical protein
VNFTTLENAIQNQVAAVSGLAGSRVIWRDQGDAIDKGVQVGKETDSITLRMENFRGLASATPEASITDQAGDPEEELGLTNTVHTEFTVEIQYFSMSKTGEDSAFARLSAVRNGLLRETITDALEAGGVSLVDCDNVQNLPSVLETQFQSRAVCQCRFRVADIDTERVTYIETVATSGIIT